MGELYNQQSQTKRRRELRSDLSYAERLLWKHLKGQQMGYKFRRQFGVGSFILDFYCPSIRLAIEIDGDTHFDPKDVSRDVRRTQYLLDKKIKEIRFTNDQVYQNLEDVLEVIRQQLPERPLPTSP